MDELKKFLLLTLGAASASMEKVDELVQELIEKGRMTVKEGKELREELVRDKEAGKHKEELKSFLSSLRLATKEDLEKLEARVAALEEQLSK
jgi:polyhydroxyalkanoate synthesis regulator phasin